MLGAQVRRHELLAEVLAQPGLVGFGGFHDGHLAHGPSLNSRVVNARVPIDRRVRRRVGDRPATFAEVGPDGTLSNFNVNAPEIAAATGGWPATISDPEATQVG